MQKIGYNKHVHHIAELCKGSTRVSESLCLGSIPSSAAKKSNSYELDFFIVSKRTTKSSVPALFDKFKFIKLIIPQKAQLPKRIFILKVALKAQYNHLQHPSV